MPAHLTMVGHSNICTVWVDRQMACGTAAGAHPSQSLQTARGRQTERRDGAVAAVESLVCTVKDGQGRV